MEIKANSLNECQVISLLKSHHQEMLLHSPEESVHALDLSELSAQGVEFYSLWLDGDLAGVGALKHIDKAHGEIKSMRTVTKYARKGVARKILQHIIEQAKQLGYKQLSLETGTKPPFIPAHRLYESFGFQVCLPFGEYQADPYSRFMTKYIGE